MRLSSKERENVATAPTQNRPSRAVRISRENAEKIADILVEAMEKKLAGLPKAERIKERERATAFFRAGKTTR